MSSRTLFSFVVVTVFFVASLLKTTLQAAPDAVDFVRDVRPILADKCYRCHGPDEKQRQADLRFDTRAGAFAERRGPTAIVPGDPGSSELVRRIFHSDLDERMPPPAAKVALSLGEKAALRRWIEAGAPWKEHWAFVSPRRSALPATRDDTSARGSIDRFLDEILAREDLEPAPEADPETLLRRLAIDLTGLPPTPAAMDDYLSDTAPDAYERAVDRLLADPAFGERMALEWMYVARYADSHGMHADGWRRMWPWRDRKSVV